MDIPVERATLVQNIEEYGTSSEGWEKIAAVTGSSKETCQKLFGILSKEAETKEKNIKKNIMGTGGGPPPKCDDDPVLEKVKGLVGSSIEGMYTYDGDSSLMELQNSKFPIEIDTYDIETPCTINSMDTDEQLSQQPTSAITTTPKTTAQDDQQSSYFTNNRVNLKKKPHHLLTRKRKLETDIPEKQSVSEKFKVLAAEKMEYLATQKELLKIQLVEEQEKLDHNRLLRAMELEDARAKYAHNEKLRALQLEKYLTDSK